MKVNDFFERVYYINLDHRTDRAEATEKELQRVGVKAERFSATYGEVMKAILQDREPINLLGGEVGVIHSHYRLLKLAIFDQLDNILILEDDIQFSENFVEEFDEWSQEIPDDWDMLYLGGNLVGWQPSPVSKHVHRGEGIFAIHALGLSQRAIKAFRDMINNDQPIDVLYANGSRQFKSYLMVPRMAWQRDDYSDIQNDVSRYGFLRAGQWPEVVGESR